MKFKKVVFIQIFLLINLLSNAQQFYLNEQIKDTLIKYPNSFEAFSKLDLSKINIPEFRQDSFLLQKSYDLFEKKYSFELTFRHSKTEDLGYLYREEQEKKNYIGTFLRETKRYSDKQINKFLDSVLKNETLFKINLDSAIDYSFKKDSIRIFSRNNWETDTRYIYFHSDLMTQRSYDTIRAYYDRYFKNSLNFNEPVLIALINMGDPEVRAKYDSVFTAKVSNKTFIDNDLTILNNFIYTEGYFYNKLSELLLLDFFFYPMGSSHHAFQLKGYVVTNYFPFFDNISIEQNITKKEELLGEVNEYLNSNKKDNIIYTFRSSDENIYKYFLDYADYMEKKEQVLYNQIKYKTEK